MFMDSEQILEYIEDSLNERFMMNDKILKSEFGFGLQCIVSGVSRGTIVVDVFDSYPSKNFDESFVFEDDILRVNNKRDLSYMVYDMYSEIVDGIYDMVVGDLDDYAPTEDDLRDYMYGI